MNVVNLLLLHNLANTQEEDDEVYLRRFDDEVAGATEDGEGTVHDEADYPDSEDESVGDYSDDEEDEDDDERFVSEHDGDDIGTPDGGFSNEADFGREECYRVEGGQDREHWSNPTHETTRGSRADEQQEAAELMNPCR